MVPESEFRIRIPFSLFIIPIAPIKISKAYLDLSLLKKYNLGQIIVCEEHFPLNYGLIL